MLRCTQRYCGKTGSSCCNGHGIKSTCLSIPNLFSILGSISVSSVVLPYLVQRTAVRCVNNRLVERFSNMYVHVCGRYWHIHAFFSVQFSTAQIFPGSGDNTLVSLGTDTLSLLSKKQGLKIIPGTPWYTCVYVWLTYGIDSIVS